MKKLVFLIPILLLIACSNKTLDIAINENSENKIEEAKEMAKEIDTDIKSEVFDKKNDKDLFIFDRSIFTNPTGTKWELTSTTSCTIDLNEYPLWVKNNMDYLLQENMNAYSQPLNSMIDLVENYKLYGDQIKWDMTANKVIIDDVMNGSQKYNMNYLHGICPAGEVKISNQNLLSKIRYTDVYLATDPNDKEFGNSFKYKWVYFDDDIRPKQKAGISWYSPEMKDFYYNYDVANYFICDLENNGKAYLCKINDNQHLDFGMWAELENDCFINIMCTYLLQPYVIEKLTLSCPVGYFKRIETYEELQEWVYLYCSIWNNYIAEEDVPNPREKSTQNPNFTNKQWITRHSNRMQNYFIMSGGRLIDNDFFVAENEDISREFLNGCVIHPEENNNYIQAVINCEKDKFRWDLSNKIYGLSGITILQNEFGGTWYDYDYTNATNETFKYMDRANAYLSKYGFIKRTLSIDDYGNETITKEIKDYVRKEGGSTFLSSHKIKNKSYFEIK